MEVIRLTLCAVVLLWSSAGIAGVYKYQNASGKWTFTSTELSPQEMKEKGLMLVEAPAADTQRTTTGPKEIRSFSGDEPSSTSTITVPSLGISLTEVKQDWYLSSSSFQKESLLSPRISCSVRNDSKAMVSGLKLKVIFVEEGNKIFGDDTKYVDDIPPGYSSKTVFLKTSMGYIFNGYNKETITRKKYRVDVFAVLNGVETKLPSIDFSSQFTE